MARYSIDLNFYGPYGDIKQMQRAVRRADGETRLLYMALESGCNPRGNNVAYVGVTEQAEPFRRFYNHHKLTKIGTIRELWAGFFFREANASIPSRRLDGRLEAAEETMISWFLPPYNSTGIDKTDDQGSAAAQKDWIGRGALVSCHLNFWWYTLRGRERSCPIRSFPKSLTYSEARGEITAIL